MWLQSVRPQPPVKEYSLCYFILLKGKWQQRNCPSHEPDLISQWVSSWHHVLVSLKPRVAEKVTSAEFQFVEIHTGDIFSVNQKCDILSVQCTLSIRGESSRTCFIEASAAAWVSSEINTQSWVTASQLTWKINRRNILDYFIYRSWLGEKKKRAENYKWHLSTPLEVEPLFRFAVFNYVRKPPPPSLAGTVSAHTNLDEYPRAIFVILFACLFMQKGDAAIWCVGLNGRQ